jgi:hypothetical protein
MRLASGLPTLFQSFADHVWYFGKDGIRSFSSTVHWENIPDISEHNRHWALVDSNDVVKSPASVLTGGSPFFIVEAASPHANRFRWIKYHGGHQKFYMDAFSLIEIFQGMFICLLFDTLLSHIHCIKGICFNNCRWIMLC